jgi:hypothetical protein
LQSLWKDDKLIQGIALARIPDVMLCPGWQGAEQKGETSDPIWGIMQQSSSAWGLTAGTKLAKPNWTSASQWSKIWGWSSSQLTHYTSSLNWKT